MSNSLPKDVMQMVEKNNLVLAIKTLAAEKNISMDEAKTLIDEYEAKLKLKQNKNVQAIATKQGLKPASISNNQNPSNSKTTDSNTSHLKTSHLKTHQLKTSQLNNSLDNHLDKIGYKKPLMPYWAKRVLVILTIVLLLSLLFLQLVP